MTENSPDGTGSQPEPPKLPGDHADSGTGQQPGTSRTDDVAESGQPEQAPAESTSQQDAAEQDTAERSSTSEPEQAAEVTSEAGPAPADRQPATVDQPEVGSAPPPAGFEQSPAAVGQPFGAQQPSPWAPAGYHYSAPPATGAQPDFGGSDTKTPASGMPALGGYPPFGPATGTQTLPPAGEPQQKGVAGLIAGIAALALIVGGAAGGLGGYLVASNNTQGSVTNALNQPPPASQAANAPAGSMQAVAQQVLPAVVEIAAEFPAQGGANGDTGSGVVLSSDGDILTNNHVISSAATGGRIQVIFSNGQTVNAAVVGRDPTTDIAVIRAQGVSGLRTASLGRSDDLQVGQPVVAIGAPFQLAGTVTSGIVSSLHRPTAASDGSQSAQATVLDAIQTDAAINPGNSGGPLVNTQGQVIGINSAIYSPSSGGIQGQSQGGSVGIGFAIPIDQAKRTANQIVQTGHAIQTVLGVKVTDNVPGGNSGQGNILPNGALISDVSQGGPADKAGLKAGAVVVKANDRPINSSDGLVAAVHAAAQGDRMKLTLSDGSTVTVTLSGQPVQPN